MIKVNHLKSESEFLTVLEPAPRRIKPSDFDYLKIIGKGSFGKVLLAKHKESERYYAIKVLQKKIVLKKKEVTIRFTHNAMRLVRSATVPRAPESRIRL